MSAEFVCIFVSVGGARVPRDGVAASFEGGPEGHSIRVLVRPYLTAAADGQPILSGIEFAAAASANTVQEARERSAGFVSGLASLLAFMANAHVGWPVFFVGYERGARPDRAFYQETVFTVRSLPAPGRTTPVDAAGEFLSRTTGSTLDLERINHALGQYHAALSNWGPNLQLVAAAHLYMAVDAIEPVIRHLKMRNEGMTEEQLARLLGVDPTAERWRSALSIAIKKDVVFSGDAKLYKSSKRARDHFVHGLSPFAAIRLAHPPDEHIKVASCVRAAILSTMNLSQVTMTSVTSGRYARPLESWPFVPAYFGRISGPDMPPDAETYPHLAVAVELRDATVDQEGRVSITPTLQPSWGLPALS